MQRKFPRQIKRVVIKVGSSIIATTQMKPRVSLLRSLVKQIASLREKNIDVVLVSSGAIVFGMGEVNQRKRPSDLSSLQALAAIGQTLLMKKYCELFKKRKKICAQVLLTWEDFDNRLRYNNARNTFQSLLDRGVIPVVNENDTIATDEIKFGDNDKLSALVAGLIQADLLIILSNVEGLYNLKSPEKKIFEEIKEITKEIEGVACGTDNKHVSKGGMTTKLEAVKIATHAQIPCVIAHGQAEDILLRILNGEKIGTLFVEKEEKLLARKHWISFGAKPKGVVIVDDGAKEALLKGGHSLLLPGIVSWQGHFKAEDVVAIEDKGHQPVGRGIINYSITELERIVDKKGKKEAIHCDNLVLCEC